MTTLPTTITTALPHAHSSGPVIKPPPRQYEQHVEGDGALTIILPTRNEAGNIPLLVARLSAALAAIPHKIIFVDDSDDDTPQVILSEEVQAYGSIRLIHRAPKERTDGLGGAVVLGLHQASNPLVCVMDADLQHPPEVVPLLVEKALDGHADLVIGSRYQEGGNAGGLNFMRFGISQFFDTFARLLFPKQLEYVSDPMTGFFLVDKNRIDIDSLHPHGFKILLEILVRTQGLRVADVPFEFGTRHAGESKADFREGVRYLWHVAQLYIGEDTLRFLRFCLIGLSGIFVNLLLTYLFTDGMGLHYLAGTALATQGSSLWNFILTETWVFQGRKPRWNRLYRLVMFLLMNNAMLMLRGPIIFMLTTGLGVHYLASSLFSIVASTLVRYMVADAWIWKRPDNNDEPYSPTVQRVA